MDITATLSRLESLETTLLSIAQEMHAIKAELQEIASRNPDLTPLLDAQEVAAVLKVDVAYVYSLARTGKIPSLKFGKYRRFTPAQIKK